MPGVRRSRFLAFPFHRHVEVHDRGVAIAARYGYSIYDSLIVAAAILSECRILYSEDLQDGQVNDGISIKNPFVAA